MLVKLWVIFIGNFQERRNLEKKRIWACYSTFFVNKRSQAMRTHPDIGLLKQVVTRCQQTCCNWRVFGCVEIVVFTVNEHESICIAELNLRPGYATDCLTCTRKACLAVVYGRRKFIFLKRIKAKLYEKVYIEKSLQLLRGYELNICGSSILELLFI